MSNLRTIITLLLIMPLSAVAQFQNIMINDKNLPSEPCIAINPKNPAEIVAGANLDNVYTSTDTGKTWQEHNLTSSYGVWGDPCIVADTAGRFYFFHLSAPSNSHLAQDWLDRLVCQQMDNMSNSWSNGSYTALNGLKDQDKEWVAVDRQTNNIYMTWTEFDLYGSNSPSDSSRILFSRSTDRGNSWSTPMRINEVSGDCIDESNTVEGAVPCVGPNGELYVAWSGPAGIRFDRSYDHGQTWLTNDKLVTTTPGWDFAIPGINRCNGLSFISCDVSNGPHRGTIYVNWSDQRNGTNNTDIWMVKSTDSGNTWTAPVKVNNDSNIAAHQFLSSMTVDAITGYIYVLFYDRRNYTDNRTDVYMAFSKDGGNTFHNQKISNSPFTPVAPLFFGDYTYIVAQGNVIRPIWGRTDAPVQSIWTAIVDTTTLFQNATDIPTVKLEMENTYPNPFYETTFISFKLKESAYVRLHVMDIYGRIVETLVPGEQLPMGKYAYQFRPAEKNLPAGVYFFNLACDDRVKTRKIVYTQ